MESRRVSVNTPEGGGEGALFITRKVTLFNSEESDLRDGQEAQKIHAERWLFGREATRTYWEPLTLQGKTGGPRRRLWAWLRCTSSRRTSTASMRRDSVGDWEQWARLFEDAVDSLRHLSRQWKHIVSIGGNASIAVVCPLRSRVISATKACARCHNLSGPYIRVEVSSSIPSFNNQPYQSLEHSTRATTPHHLNFITIPTQILQKSTS